MQMIAKKRFGRLFLPLKSNQPTERPCTRMIFKQAKSGSSILGEMFPHEMLLSYAARSDTVPLQSAWRGGDEVFLEERGESAFIFL
ncbi:hypothetical protein CEXT_320551 [Caerostris extrusa]|uniref:Uncharacterized protein n=1 Tax=Caerostris extrusa TaxID=172846 RepID=A0AAV4WGV9_CAEEX|nr:hypothetical protein CEXT_320551 [Caerostris extrusa]